MSPEKGENVFLRDLGVGLEGTRKPGKEET